MLTARRASRAALLALALAGAAAPGTARAAQGDLDPTYGQGGFAEQLPDVPYGAHVAVAPDGSAYGSTLLPPRAPGESFRFVLTRTSPGGVADRAFGGAGQLQVPSALPGGWFRGGGTILRHVLDPTGRLVYGTDFRREVDGSNENGFAVFRSLADGRPDTTFGAGGTALVEPGTVGVAGLYTDDPTTDARGRVLVAVSTYGSPSSGGAVVRLTSTGQLDRSFGTGGIASVADTSFAGTPAVGTDGTIGVPVRLADGDLGVAQLDDAGRPVVAFGDQGRVDLDADADTYDGLVLAVRPAGGYIVLGRDDADARPELLATTADGRVDAGFGVAGRTRLAKDVPDGGSPVTASWFALQPSGRVLSTATVLGADGTARRELERWLPDGRPDTAFAAGGTARPSDVDLGSLGVAYDPSRPRVLLYGKHPGADGVALVALQGNDPPLPAIDPVADDALHAGSAVRLSGASSSDGPGGHIASYRWDLDGDGVAGDATGEQVTTTYATPGTRTVALVTTDDDGAQATARRVLRVGDPLPPGPTATATTPTATAPPVIPSTPAPPPRSLAAATTVAGRASLTGSRRVRVDRSRRVRVLLRCPAGTSGCAGTLMLRVGPTTVARSRYRLEAGATTKLRLRLSATAVRRVTRRSARTVVLVGGRTIHLRIVR